MGLVAFGVLGARDDEGVGCVGDEGWPCSDQGDDFGEFVGTEITLDLEVVVDLDIDPKSVVDAQRL